MVAKNDGERLAALETETKNIVGKINSVENSVQALHGKFDTFSNTISENYVAKATFEEYKNSRLMERLLTILVTSIITGLVSFFIVRGGIR